VVSKSSIFWDITPFSPLKVNQGFGGTCRLHLLGQRIIKAGNQRENMWEAEFAGFLPGLFFDPEDEADIFLRNVR
jgi:hypothetical protein